MFNTALTIVITASTAASAYSWYRSATVEVPAPPESGGVGALLGGYLIGLNKGGERYDMIETLKLQGEWNKRGAALACVAVAATGLQQVVPLILSFATR